MTRIINRRWCYTVNNYTAVEEARFRALPCIYHVFGKETGESGTPHLQGFVTFKSSKALSAMKKIHPSAHFEVAKHTSIAAANYCKKGEQSSVEWKEEGIEGATYGINADIFEEGELPTPGKRNDLVEILKSVKEGADLVTVAELDPATFVRNYRGIQFYQALQCKDYEHHSVRGIWLHGPSGKGKSHHARKFSLNFNGMYNKPQSKWFDGYAGEDVILLDDMDCDMLCHYLKIWTDKYACTGEIKGGTVKLRHKWFIVTSNQTIEELFKDKADSMREAIARRFYEIPILKKRDDIVVLNQLINYP